MDAHTGALRVIPGSHRWGEGFAMQLQEALKDPTVKQRFNDLGTDPVALDKATPAALQAHLKAETDKWGPLIKKAGVYAD